MINYIKWISIILVSLFLAWFIPLLFWGHGLNTINSLPKNERDEIYKESANIISKGLKPIFDDIQNQTLPVSVPKQDNKTLTYEYTKPRKSTISDKDKACNAAIFRAMSDKSKEAQDNKLNLCAHNID